MIDGGWVSRPSSSTASSQARGRSTTVASALEPFAPLPRTAKRAVESEASRSRRGCRLMDIGAHLSSSGGIHKAVDRAEAVGADSLQVFTQSPRDVAADEPRSGKLRALPRAPRRGRAQRRPLPRALPVQPRRAERRRLREVCGGDAQHDGGRMRDRRRRRRLPRRLASRLRLRGRARARRCPRWSRCSSSPTTRRGC